MRKWESKRFLRMKCKEAEKQAAIMMAENDRLKRDLEEYKKAEAGDCVKGGYCERCRHGRVAYEGAYTGMGVICLKNVRCKQYEPREEKE